MFEFRTICTVFCIKIDAGISNLAVENVSGNHKEIFEACRLRFVNLTTVLVLPVLGSFEPINTVTCHADISLAVIYV